jgi:hypothetical protein
MNYYVLGENDQTKSSWAIFEMVKPLPKHQRRRELPPVMYKFFGPDPGGEMAMKPPYQRFRCSKCGLFDDDAIFDVGFCDPVTIRIKGDFSTTQDRVFAISDKLFNVLRSAKTRGYETKPLSSSGWHALRVTERVDCDENVMELIPPFCAECGRPARAPGEFTQVNQLSLPRSSNTLFTTRNGWPKPFSSRYIFVTEEVVTAFKSGGIKGGYFTRLWTDQEVQTAAEKAKSGKKWKPPGTTVLL